MFKNMKIGMRLGLGFGIVMILLAVIAFIGISRLGNINDSLSDIVKDKYPKTVWAGDMKDSVNQIAISMRNMVLTSDKAKDAKELETIQEMRKVIKDRLEKLEQHIRSDKGKEKFKAMVDARAAYIGVQEQFLKDVAEGKDDEAKEILFTTLGPKQMAYGHF